MLLFLTHYLYSKAPVGIILGFGKSSFSFLFLYFLLQTICQWRDAFEMKKFLLLHSIRRVAPSFCSSRSTLHYKKSIELQPSRVPRGS